MSDVYPKPNATDGESSFSMLTYCYAISSLPATTNAMIVGSCDEVGVVPLFWEDKTNK